MLALRSLVLAFAAAPALAQSVVYQFDGIAPEDRGGSCVAGVGDLNGDGIDDVALGLPLADPAGIESGRVHVHSGLDGTLIRTYLGLQPGQQFGSSVDSIGDINADGVPDLIVGASQHDLNAGVTLSGIAYLVSGAGGVIGSFTGSSSADHLGYAVAGVGDIDGDGTPDFAYSAPLEDGVGADSGALYVHSGATWSLLFKISGSNAGDRLGWSIDGAGDVDGDGLDDLIVGAPGYNNFLQGKPDCGRFYVYGLGAAAPKLIFASTGSWSGGQYGHSVAGVGDVNGDNVPDLAAGSPYASANGQLSGEARVISGQGYFTIHTIVGTTGTQAGWAVAGPGDMTGDGRNEVLVSEPWYSFLASTQTGLVRCINGATGLQAYSWNGPQNGSLLGYSVACAGDLNKDGYPDVVMGMPFNDTEYVEAGSAYVALAAAPNPQVYCTAKVNSSGCTPKIASNGVLSLTIADNFHVTASKILPNVPGIMIWSQGPATIPFGGGTLCVAPQIKRTPGQFSGGSPAIICSGNFDFHFSQAYVASTSLVGGANIFAQYWSRDSGFAAPNNMSLTDAVSFFLLP